MSPYGAAHNSAFGSYAAAMDGQSAESFSAAQAMRKFYDEGFEVQEGAPGMDVGWNLLLCEYARFARWDLVLADNRTISQPYATALRHYARGMAWAAMANRSQFESERGNLLQVLPRVNADEKDLALVVNASITARGALLDGDVGLAIELMRTATEQQLAWTYYEPPNFHYPMRQCLGALLLHDGQAAEAETTYRADLTQYLRNPWSLLGLSQAMEAQPHKYTIQEIGTAQHAFEKAWARSDTKIASSCPLFFGVHHP